MPAARVVGQVVARGVGPVPGPQVETLEILATRLHTVVMKVRRPEGLDDVRVPVMSPTSSSWAGSTRSAIDCTR